MQITGVRGIQVVPQGGTAVERINGGGDAAVSELRARYYQTTQDGQMFSIANQAAVSTSAALTTTFTGLSIANPVGSGFNLVLNKFKCAQFAAGAAGAIGIMVGAGASAGTLIPVNRRAGGAASVAVASAGSTLGGTPVLWDVFGSVGSVATTGYGLQAGVVVDLEGSLIIPPGYFAASYTTAATTSALIFGFQWEEISIFG